MSGGGRYDPGARYQVLVGQSAETIRALPAGCARLSVSSPPYFYQRDYGVEDQIGLEQWTDENGKTWADLDRYIARLVEVYAAVHHALADDGLVFLNLGDKYAGSGGAGGDYAKVGFREGQRRFPPCRVKGIPDRNLLLVPARVALALQAWGWYIRQEIIWHKTNVAPTGVSSRPLTAHETIYQLAKSPKHFFDFDSIRIKNGKEATWEEWEAAKGSNKGADGDRMGKGYRKRSITLTHPLGMGPRSVWEISSNRHHATCDHYAAYPPGLAEPCIKAGSEPGDLVLDPFSGTATTGVVALGLGRRYVGVELNPEYAASSLERLAEAAKPLAVKAAEEIESEIPGQGRLFG